ncbi:MAG: hypothetical protein KTR31_26615 [Myxococcales bacterium]|nr:hypothetical protein [Myxococcales bacterium]
MKEVRRWGGAGILLASTMTGCASESIVGAWTFQNAIATERLELTGDGGGTWSRLGRLQELTLEGAWDVAWEEVTEADYSLELTCTSFKMWNGSELVDEGCEGEPVEVVDCSLSAEDALDCVSDGSEVVFGRDA